ncbi:MAG: hypothetical protein KME08_03670 [Aphanothece sp. CMT-3BRIN-NPC111]|nr:hypothetical protein [Aphanothece sp. CMT-3BRIN-NPC111]
MTKDGKQRHSSYSHPAQAPKLLGEYLSFYTQIFLGLSLSDKLTIVKLLRSQTAGQRRSRTATVLPQNQFQVGFPMPANLEECLPEDLAQAVVVNKQPITFNCFILGFLYLWLGVFSSSALADTKVIEQPPENSPVIKRQATTTVPDASEPFQWSTSASSLLSEKQVAAEEIAPINQTPNNGTSTEKIAQLNQPDNNATPIEEVAPLNQPDNNAAPIEEVAPLNQPDNNATPIEQQITLPGLRGNSLQGRHPLLTTAHQLLRGEVLPSLRYRQSFPPEDVVNGLTGQPTLGISWGITNNLELTLDAQTVDNFGPGRQGDFRAQRTTTNGSGNFFQELTLQAKQRLWQNAQGTQALSGVVAISRGVRSYRFSRPGAGNLPSGGNKDELVPSLEFPFTVTTGDRWQFTVSPKVAFLPEDNALYFRRLPIPDSGSFGTTFGLAGAASYRVNSRLVLWGDAFVPLTGNNTIDRDTGLPARSIGFNAGVRYLVNPRLATDLFVSNTLGNTGALSMITDKEYPFLGLGVTFLPGVTSANRRYPASFRSTQQPPPETPAGFAFLDGGTVRSGQLVTSVQGGGQGLLAAVQFGLLDDLEIGSFIDLVPGTTDESEFGFSGKIRFLHQADGDPVTLSAVATLARSNNVLINLVNNNANEFEERGFKKGGFAFSNEGPGELFIITLSTPIHYQFANGGAIWATPTLGFVQRNGLQIAGINFGSSTPVLKNLDLIGEVGLEFSGKGNAFVDRTRETVIPFSLGLRWNPSLRQIPGLQLEGFLTNRVGSSPFGTLRVQADKSVSVGVGVRLPVQF